MQYSTEKSHCNARKETKIIGFHSRDDMAIFGVQNNGKMSLKFCIITESNSQKNCFPIVQYMAAVTSRENREQSMKQCESLCRLLATFTTYSDKMGSVISHENLG